MLNEKVLYLLNEYGKGKETLIKECDGDKVVAQELLDVATFIHDNIDNADEGYDRIKDICEENDLEFKEIIATITAMLIIRAMCDKEISQELGE